MRSQKKKKNRILRNNFGVSMDEAGKTETDFTGRELEVFKIYKNFNTRNKHKMIPIPICEIPENLK